MVSDFSLKGTLSPIPFTLLEGLEQFQNCHVHLHTGTELEPSSSVEGSHRQATPAGAV